MFAEKEAFHKRKREQLQNEKGWKLNTENQDKEIIAKLTVHTEKRRRGPEEQCVRFSTCCAGGNKNTHCVYITPSKSKLSKIKIQSRRKYMKRREIFPEIKDKS